MIKNDKAITAVPIPPEIDLGRCLPNNPLMIAPHKGRQSNMIKSVDIVMIIRLTY
jgi:hypothetical protein